MTILQFNLPKKPSRQQAIQWLSAHYDAFPQMTEDKPISDSIFYGWRFVLGLDGIVYFGNCVEAGISEIDLIEFKLITNEIILCKKA